jgi:hypothetical protein
MRRKTQSNFFRTGVVGIDYREDVYRAMKAFAGTHPKLSGEDKKLFDETMRDYRRAGLDLTNEKRKEVEELRKQLAKLGTDFDTNIVNAKAPIVFAKAELDGLPESFLAAPGIKTGDDAYTVLANVTWQYNTLEDNAKNEPTRKKLTSRATVWPKTQPFPFSIKCSPCATRSRSGSVTNHGTIIRLKLKWPRLPPARNRTSTNSFWASTRNLQPKAPRAKK